MGYALNELPEDFLFIMKAFSDSNVLPVHKLRHGDKAGRLSLLTLSLVADAIAESRNMTRLLFALSISKNWRALLSFSGRSMARLSSLDCFLERGPRLVAMAS